MSTYLERYFQPDDWKRFFLGLKKLRFCCFWQCWFNRDQESQFGSNTFSRIFSSKEILDICLPYIKRYFQEHQWSAFFFRVEISQIMFFLGMLVLEWSKIAVWEQYLFQNFFALKVLCMCLPYIKSYFQEHQWSAFFFRAEMPHILLFLRMQFQRDQSSQFESNIFSRIFSPIEFFRLCLSYVKRYYQTHQWKSIFFMAQITQILFPGCWFWRDQRSLILSKPFQESFFTM